MSQDDTDHAWNQQELDERQLSESLRTLDEIQKELKDMTERLIEADKQAHIEERRVNKELLRRVQKREPRTGLISAAAFRTRFRVEQEDE